MTEQDIVSLNTGLIYKILNQYFYGVDREDLFQEGVVGILKAYKNYVKNGTTKFSTYAFSYIFGEMYKFATQKQIKVSKEYLQLYKEIETFRYCLAQKKGYIPTNKELAVYMKRKPQEIEEAIVASTITINSLDKRSDEERSIHETIPTQEAISWDDRIAIEEGLEQLSEEERQIIIYYYLQEMTQEEIARKLKKNQVMISRYKKRGLEKMRAFYN